MLLQREGTAGLQAMGTMSGATVASQPQNGTSVQGSDLFLLPSPYLCRVRREGESWYLHRLHGQVMCTTAATVATRKPGQSRRPWAQHLLGLDDLTHSYFPPDLGREHAHSPQWPLPLDHHHCYHLEDSK